MKKPKKDVHNEIESENPIIDGVDDDDNKEGSKDRSCTKSVEHVIII